MEVITLIDCCLEQVKEPCDRDSAKQLRHTTLS